MVSLKKEKEGLVPVFLFIKMKVTLNIYYDYIIIYI